MKQFSNYEAQTSTTVQSSRVSENRLDRKSTGEAPFTFPPSVQVDLFNYLKPHQQKALKPYLRLIKRPYQEKLCTSLLDYMEGNGLNTLEEPVLASLQEHIVEACHLHPLTTREPKSIGAIIKELFPSFSGRPFSPQNLKKI